MSGHLSVFLGPMGSGKTTRAKEQVSQFCSLGFKTAYVISDLDKKRNSSNNLPYSHNPHSGSIDPKATILSCDNLSILPFDDYEVIIIDEAQFFPEDDLVSVVRKLVKNKYVQVYGLSGDFKGNKFGGVIELIPFADTFEQMTAKCVECTISKRLINASFTDKLSDDQGDILEVAGMGLYKPVCRLHHTKLC
jgi:thymidine kinase